MQGNQNASTTGPHHW